MKRLAILLLLSTPLAGHMISISTGALRVEGNEVDYELRMPLYEVEYIEQPEQTLFAHFSIASRGRQGALRERSCREARADGEFVCRALYTFPAPVEEVEIKCTYYAVTVPNHAHILRASRGDTTVQEIFDLTFHRAEINFIPPTPLQLAWRQISAGVMRVVSVGFALLFLAALVLAARGRREFFALIGMFVLGEAVASLVLPVTGWAPAPRFVDAAAALTIAYLAVEILLLPNAGQRWVVVGILGLFHGLYLALFISSSGYSRFYVLLGVGLAEVLLGVAIALVFSRVGRLLSALRPVPVSAGILFLVGIGWFFLRLRG